MSGPSDIAEADIPKDVLAVGVSIARDLPYRVGPHSRDFAALVIARAILAERERCAAIAQQANEHYAQCQADMKMAKDRFKARDFESMRIAAGGMAAAIRKGGA